MSVTLRKKENKNSTSLYLDIYHNGKRTKEYLKECTLKKAKNTGEKIANQEKLRLAKQIEIIRAHELQSNDYNIISNFKNKINILDYFNTYIENYTKKDKRNIECVAKHFKTFLIKKNISNLLAKQLDEALVFEFAEYLKSLCKGEGANSYFARFKKVIKQAVREKIIINNPCIDITIKREENIRKDVLTIKDLQLLSNIKIQNNNVKRAFLFCCFTGLRWVDIYDLTWENIDLNNNYLTKIQNKTGIKVKIHLSENALQYLSEINNSNEKVFKLPSHNGALQILKDWIKKANINKHITWHCARHSFATNLIYYKNDILTVSELLGHSSIKYTQRYTRISDDLKENAVNSLPKIN